MFSKIIYIGLPGAGKTSAATQLAKTHDLIVCSSDIEIKKILNDYKNNCLDHGSPYGIKLNELKEQFKKEGLDSIKVEQAFQCEGHEKHSSAFMSLLGEPYWRRVEANQISRLHLLINILNIYLI